MVGDCFEEVAGLEARDPEEYGRVAGEADTVRRLSASATCSIAELSTFRAVVEHPEVFDENMGEDGVCRCIATLLAFEASI